METKSTQRTAKRLVDIITLMDSDNPLGVMNARGRLWRWLVESLNSTEARVFNIIWRSNHPITDAELMTTLDWVFDGRWQQLKVTLGTLKDFGLIEQNDDKWRVKR